MRRFVGILGLCALASVPALAQPSTDAVKALQERFAAERKLALEQKFPAVTLSAADELAKRANTAAENHSSLEAAHLYREARWQIPYLPTGLPAHISRVFGVPRLRHGDSIERIAFSPDGTRLATASDDGTVRIWDLGNGRELRAYRGQIKEKIHGLAWSPDSSVIASAGGLTIDVWEPETGTKRYTLTGHAADVRSLSIRNDGKRLVSGSDDKTIRVWDLTTGKLEVILNDQMRGASITQVVYHPTANLIASTEFDGTLREWQPDRPPPAQKLVVSLSAHAQSANAVAFAPDGKSLYTGGSDKVAKRYGATDSDGKDIPGTGSKQAEFNLGGGGHSETVTCVAVSPDGKLLATGSVDRSVRVWDIASARVIRSYLGHTQDITALAFSPDGSILASASKDQNVRLWPQGEADEHRNFAGHESAVWSAVLRPDGKQLASAGDDRTILLRDVTGGKPPQKLEGHTQPITTLAYLPDGKTLASAGGDAVVKLWETDTGKFLRECKGHAGPIMAVVASTDGKLILSGGADKIARMWNPATAELKYAFPAVRSVISAVALRRDGKQALLGCADGSVHVFDLSESSAKETSELIGHFAGVGALTYSKEGSQFASVGGDRIVKLWSISTGSGPVLLGDFKGHTNALSAVAISEDGKLIASGGGDRGIKIWDVAKRTEVRTLRGHSDWVSWLAFGPEDRSLVSAGVDKSVRIWELNREDVTSPAGHTKRLNTLAVTSDGKRLASGSDDNLIQIWNLETGREEFSLSGHTKKVTALAFTSDGKTLLSGGDDNKLRRWNLADRKEVSATDCDMMPMMVTIPKGDRYLCWFLREGPNMVKATTVQMFDKDGKLLQTLSETQNAEEKPIQCVNFTPEGDRFASGRDDGSVRIWNFTNNERIAEIPAHAKSVGDLCFTPDSKKLLTADTDGEVKIWSLADGKPKQEKKFPTHAAGIYTMAMSPDGKHFVTVGKTGEVKLWSLADAKTVRTWDMPTPVTNLVFTADSKKIVTANGDATLYVLDLP